MKRGGNRGVWIGTAAVVVSGAAWAGEPSGQGDGDLLRGPSVSSPAGGGAGADAMSAAASEETLVRRDAAGRLVRLEVTAEEAAIDLIRPRLEAATAERIEGVLARRAAAWDAFLREHYREIVELSGGGKDADRTPRVLALVAKAPAGLKNADAMRTEIMEALPAAEAARFRGLVEGYRAAVGEEAKAEAAVRGVGVAKVLAEEAFRSWGREVRRAFERESGMGQARLEAGLKALALSPDDELKVRNMIVAYAQKQKFDGATGADKVRLFFELRKVLSAEQVRTLRRVAGEGEPKKP